MTENNAVEKETMENETMETETAETETAETETAETETAEIEPAENTDAEKESIETEPTETEPAETEPTETETPPATAAKPGTEDNSANRGYFLKVVAGCYLIYTAYELANSYLKNEEGSSLGFCVAGIVFGLIGVFLLYIVIRDYLRENKQKPAEPAAEAQASGTEGKNADEAAQNVDKPRQM